MIPAVEAATRTPSMQARMEAEKRAAAHASKPRPKCRPSMRDAKKAAAFGSLRLFEKYLYLL